MPSFIYRVNCTTALRSPSNDVVSRQTLMYAAFEKDFRPHQLIKRSPKIIHLHRKTYQSTILNFPLNIKRCSTLQPLWVSSPCSSLGVSFLLQASRAHFRCRCFSKLGILSAKSQAPIHKQSSSELKLKTLPFSKDTSPAALKKLRPFPEAHILAMDSTTARTQPLAQPAEPLLMKQHATITSPWMAPFPPSLTTSLLPESVGVSRLAPTSGACW
jgi:hypothetical protein